MTETPMTDMMVADDRGSITPLLALLFGGIALALAVLALQTEHGVRTARAQWAADGSAMAAAAEVVPGLEGGGAAARRAAAAVATANGARLISVQVGDESGGRVGGTSHPGMNASTPISPVVSVEVEVGGVRARAAAAQFAVAEP